MRKLILLVLLLLIALYNCTKNPVTSIAHKDSIVYIPSGNMVFLIDSSNDQIIDSITFDFRIKDLNLSPDKRILYLQKDYPDTTSFVEIDVKSKTVLYEGGNSSLYHTSDGKYLVSTSGSLRLFSATTHEVIYQDTLEVTGRPAFDSRNSVFYVAMKDNRILVFDYARMRIVKFLYALTDKKIYRIFDLLYSEIDNRLYFSANTITQFPFEKLYSYIGSMNPKSDKIIKVEQIGPNWCAGFMYNSLATQKILSLSGCCICIVIPESIPFKLFGFSQISQEIISELDGSNAAFVPFGLRVLDEGRKAYIVDDWAGGVIIVDLVQNKIVGYINTGIFVVKWPHM